MTVLPKPREESEGKRYTTQHETDHHDPEAGRGRIGNAGVVRQHGISEQTTDCIAKKDSRCEVGTVGGSAGVGPEPYLRRSDGMSGGRWTLSVIASVAGGWFGC
jgi:hypothetical protein